MKYRIPKQAAGNNISKEDFLTAIHYCRRYDDFKSKLERCLRAEKSGSVQSFGERADLNVTEAAASCSTEYKRRIELIESAVTEAGAEIYEWLLIGVTKGYNYIQLLELGIPCSRNYYYAKRRQVYYIVSRKI